MRQRRSRYDTPGRWGAASLTRSRTNNGARCGTAKLASLDTIRATMALGNRQLLTLDTSGRRVQAAVAVGNVDTAEHVAVFTPGFTSTVDGSLKGYDQGMQDLLK